MNLTAPGLENADIRLEPLSEAHREPLRATKAAEFIWRSLPVIERGAGFDPYFSHVLCLAKKGETLPFAIICRADNRLVGVTAFVGANRKHRRVMIGYTWLDASVRGRGVYKGVQSLLIKRAIMWGARRIGWHVEAHNTLAINAIKALGAVHEGTLRSYSRFADGTWVDIALLSMMREEAKDAVLRLDARMPVTSEA